MSYISNLKELGNWKVNMKRLAFYCVDYANKSGQQTRKV